MTLLLLGEGVADIANIIRLQTRLNADAVRTSEGELRVECAKPQLDVIVDLAEEYGIRAWDAAASSRSRSSPISPSSTRPRHRSQPSTRSRSTTEPTGAPSTATRTSP